MHKKLFIALVVTVLIFALGMQIGLSKEKESTELDASKLVDKLDQVLVNQAKILKQVEEVKQELTIVKVRCSR